MRHNDSLLAKATASQNLMWKALALTKQDDVASVSSVLCVTGGGDGGQVFLFVSRDAFNFLTAENETKKCNRLVFVAGLGGMETETILILRKPFY